MQPATFGVDKSLKRDQLPDVVDSSLRVGACPTAGQRVHGIRLSDEELCGRVVLRNGDKRYQERGRGGRARRSDNDPPPVMQDRERTAQLGSAGRDFGFRNAGEVRFGWGVMWGADGQQSKRLQLP